MNRPAGGKLHCVFGLSERVTKNARYFFIKINFFDYYLQYFTKPDPLWYGTLQKPAGYPALRAGIRDTDQH